MNTAMDRSVRDMSVEERPTCKTAWLVCGTTNIKQGEVISDCGLPSFRKAKLHRPGPLSINEEKYGTEGIAAYILVIIVEDWRADAIE